MTQDDFQPWIEQTANQPGLLACGIKASQFTCVVSLDASYPERRIKELMLALSEVGLTLRQDHLAGGRWRWVFENAQIHSARRDDGSLAVLILPNNALMTSVADSALAQFVAFTAPAEHAAEVIMTVPDEGAEGIINS